MRSARGGDTLAPVENPPANRLYYGDNLAVLRESISSESVDLIYLDPPFNSNANYNVLFSEASSGGGGKSRSQVLAFEDTWHWGNESERAYAEILKSGNTQVSEMVRAMRSFLGVNDMMAYLVMMAVRLLELHRVLKSDGSIYLHCDSTASHYLKILMDAVFGARHFMNEVTWKRTSAHSDSGRFGRNTDTLLFYGKSAQHTWNAARAQYTEKYLQRFRFSDPDGRKWQDDNLTAKGLSGGGYEYEFEGVTSLWRYPIETMRRLHRENRLHFTRSGGIRLKRYLDEAKGAPLQALWDDIAPINSQAKERLGYRTQKPLALLERIVETSSSPGDLVLDPFCGCGTTVHAAQKLKRAWIGIDITHLAISLVEKRLKDAFPGVHYEVHGTPKDLAGAKALAAHDKYQFQWWALSLLDAIPYQAAKKGADGGIDGLIYFREDKRRTGRVIISVKGGANVGVAMIRDLKGVLERENAPLGIFITLKAPSAPMRAEAAAAGIYESVHFGGIPRIQIATIEELLAGRGPRLPLAESVFRRAERENDRVQEGLPALLNPPAAETG